MIKITDYKEIWIETKGSKESGGGLRVPLGHYFGDDEIESIIIE